MINNDEVLIKAEHVSKKFCRSLKRSLWYGAQDIGRSLMPWTQSDSIDNVNESDNNGLPFLRKDEFWAVRDVSFEIRRGECLGLIGHNGSGKSTLLKMLYGLNLPDVGCITTRGRVGALIELSAGFNPILSGRENIYNQAALLGFSKTDTDKKFDHIVEFSEIADFIDMPVQNYSSGMKVRLGFSIAAQMEPDILLVDEVLAVGDAGFRQKCINALAELMRVAAVIFVSHSMPQIQRVCTKVMHLDSGEVDFLGAPVSAGIGRYFSRYTIQGAEARGDGSVKVSAIRLSAGGQEWTNTNSVKVEQNGVLGVEIDVVCQKELPPLVVHIIFWNLEMIPVLEILDSLDRGFPFRGSENLRVLIDDLPLSPGKYSLSVIVAREDLRCTYLHLSNAASIVVAGDSASGAVCLKQGCWKQIVDDK